jgi:hypothetical protein
MTQLPEKICQACGRRIVWRKAWERSWDEVKYCSDACRKMKPGIQDRALEDRILSLLSQRARDATICPSEAARLVFPDTWQEQMEAARRAARRLVAEGKIVITQQSHIVDPSTAKGPIRLRLPR